MSQAERPGPLAGGRRSVAAALVLIALPCAFFAPVLFAGQVLLPATDLAHLEPWSQVLPPQPRVYWNALTWDAMAQYLPWRAFAHRWLAQGVIPLWNPHQFCGTPFVANGQSALFYPLNLIFWLFDPARAFGWAMALHFALAGLFAFAFLRTLGLGRFGALLGGVAFQFCGFFITWAELPTLVNAGIWLPLVLLCIERFFQSHRMRYALAGGGAIGVALLAGHPQMAFYLLLGAGTYFVFRWACDLRDGGGRRAAWLGPAGGAAALAVAGALASVQLLPVVEILPYSHRAGGGGAGAYQWFVKFAMPWRHLVTMTLPDFFGRPTDGTYWDWPAGNYAELVTYVGIAPLLLAALAVAWRRSSRCPRQIGFFAVGAVVALLTAMGTPLNALLVRLVPGFGGPGRMLYLWACFLALLAGIGADALMVRLRQGERLRTLARDALLAAGALVAVTLALAAAAWLSRPVRLRPPLADLVGIPGPGVVVLVVVLIWAGVLAAGARRWVSAGFVGAAVLALTVGDLFIFGVGYNPTSRPRFVYPETPEIKTLKQAGPNLRFMAFYVSWPIGAGFPEAALPPNAATVYGLYDVAGYDSIYLQGYKNSLAEALGYDPSPAANGNMILIRWFTLDAAKRFGVRAWLAPRAALPPWRPAAKVGMAMLPPHAGSFRAAVVPLRLFATVGPPETPARIRVISPNALEVLIPREAALEAGVLHLRDTWFPGWRAAVDGRAVESATEGKSWSTQFVALPRGAARVEFRYEPATFRFGLFVTLCALAFLAAAGAALAQRRPR